MVPGGPETVVREALAEAGLTWEEPKPATFVVLLPGERKLRTSVALVLGKHSLSVNAFVMRRPDENSAGVHRWLLEHNVRAAGVAYAVDHLGDVYVVGRLPLAAVSPDAVDAILGAVHELADGAFNVLLELGFASSIRKEWAWRRSRGESSANLAAFAHLAGDGPAEPPAPH